jgi:nucleoside-diphosphate-sugar epimerase
MKVLVTGANGFVGSAVVQRCVADRLEVRAAVRSTALPLPQEVEVVAVDDLSSTTDWSKALREVGVVVHTAARVHMMRGHATDSLTKYRTVNVEGTLNLARQAAKAGVKRLVFLSSIKVNGDRTAEGRPFKADDRPAPADAYAISKNEAEIGLLEVARTTNLEVVILRSVVVYGPGARANILSMMRWLNRRVPLPLGAVRSKRSFVALDNLVDLIITSMTHPAAANEIFLVSDGESVSTADLLRRTARALGKRAMLVPVPVWMLRLVGRVARQEALVRRLCDSLEVDIEKTRRVLDWDPPVSTDDALEEAARAYLGREPRPAKPR